MNAIDCMYSKLPTDEEQLIYSKHVEDIYWNKFKKKVHLIGSYYARKKITMTFSPYKIYELKFTIVYLISFPVVQFALHIK